MWGAALGAGKTQMGIRITGDILDVLKSNPEGKIPQWPVHITSAWP